MQTQLTAQYLDVCLTVQYSKTTTPAIDSNAVSIVDPHSKLQTVSIVWIEVAAPLSVYCCNHQPHPDYSRHRHPTSLHVHA
eukprot:m.1488742 g.1488742  ORF g.1488742 m.1488742 type:complete len:81 (-) comp25188_c1_seq5:1291-1533(-)